MLKNLFLIASSDTLMDFDLYPYRMVPSAATTNKYRGGIQEIFQFPSHILLYFIVVEIQRHMNFPITITTFPATVLVSF